MSKEFTLWLARALERQARILRELAARQARQAQESKEKRSA